MNNELEKQPNLELKQEQSPVDSPEVLAQEHTSVDASKKVEKFPKKENEDLAEKMKPVKEVVENKQGLGYDFAEVDDSLEDKKGRPNIYRAEYWSKEYKIKNAA